MQWKWLKCTENMSWLSNGLAGMLSHNEQLNRLMAMKVTHAIHVHGYLSCVSGNILAFDLCMHSMHWLKWHLSLLLEFTEADELFELGVTQVLKKPYNSYTIFRKLPAPPVYSKLFTCQCEYCRPLPMLTQGILMEKLFVCHNLHPAISSHFQFSLV